MTKGVLLWIVIGLVVCIQFSRCDDKQDKKSSCKEKLLSKISQGNLKQYPKCFDTSKLTDLKGNAKGLQTIFDGLKENCTDIKGCLTYFNSILLSKSDEVQGGLQAFVNTFFDASKGCFTLLVDNAGEISQWVMSGCADEL